MHLAKDGLQQLTCVVAFASIFACGRTLDLGHGDAGDSASSAPVTCDSVCDRVIACGLVESAKRSSCLAQCVGTPQSQLQCAAATPCPNIISSCAPSVSEPLDGSVVTNPFEITECQEACDNLSFFGCLDPDQLEACRSTCSSATSAKRTSFSSCASSPARDCSEGDPSSRGIACYQTFIK